MAKTIKAIQCPQCGSVKNTEIKQDTYRCEGCATEYFLDSDDINVYHHNAAQSSERVIVDLPQKTSFRMFFWVLLIMLVPVSYSYIKHILTKKSVNSATSTSTQQLSAVVKKTYPPEIPERWESPAQLIFEGVDKTPYLITVGKIQSNNRGGQNNGDHLYISIIDILTKKSVSFQDTHIDFNRFNSSNKYELREWDNGDIMLLINQSKLYRLDKIQKIFIDVTESVLAGIPEFKVGIAQLEYGYASEGNHLGVMTNEGKQYFFYPLFRKVYAKNNRERPENIPVPENTPAITAYSFSKVSTDFPDEKIQLIKYTHKNAPGYPREKPSFSWMKDFGGSGIFTERSPYKKVFIGPWGKKSARLVNYRDLTPDRLYFSPSILAMSDQEVVISFYASPAVGSPRLLQSVDGNTGQVRWTYQSETPHSYDSLRIIDSGYILMGSMLNLLNKAGESTLSLDPKTVIR